jgi:hypothetical protein
MRQDSRLTFEKAGAKVALSVSILFALFVRFQLRGIQMSLKMGSGFVFSAIALIGGGGFISPPLRGFDPGMRHPDWR